MNNIKETEGRSSVVFAGVDVGDRWQQLCKYWESHAEEHFLVSGLNKRASAVALFFHAMTTESNTILFMVSEGIQ